MFTKTVFAALGAISLLAAAGPSAARDGGAEVSSVRIAYRDLDLASPEGAKVMLARIHRAASMVCNGGLDEGWDIARRNQVRACVRHASDEAVSSLAAPMVTAMSHGDSHAMMAALAGR